MLSSLRSVERITSLLSLRSTIKTLWIASSCPIALLKPYALKTGYTVVVIVPELLDPRKEGGKTLYIGLIVLLVAAGSFGLGRLSALTVSQGGFSVVEDNDAFKNGTAAAASTVGQGPSSTSGQAGEATEGGYIGSKTGKKYYFPWCGSVAQIKEENKIWFKDLDEAKASGYTPGNCKGLE